MKKSRQNVLVLGAGIAGLSTALKIQELIPEAQVGILTTSGKHTIISVQMLDASMITNLQANNGPRKLCNGLK